MQQCQFCGAPLPDNARFCGSCGRVQEPGVQDAQVDDDATSLINPQAATSDEEEERRKRLLPPFVPLTGGASGAPMTPGTPQANMTPGIQGAPGAGMPQAGNAPGMQGIAQAGSASGNIQGISGTPQAGNVPGGSPGNSGFNSVSGGSTGNAGGGAPSLPQSAPQSAGSAGPSSAPGSAGTPGASGTSGSPQTPQTWQTSPAHGVPTQHPEPVQEHRPQPHQPQQPQQPLHLEHTGPLRQHAPPGEQRGHSGSLEHHHSDIGQRDDGYHADHPEGDEGSDRTEQLTQQPVTQNGRDGQGLQEGQAGQGLQGGQSDHTYPVGQAWQGSLGQAGLADQSLHGVQSGGWQGGQGLQGGQNGSAQPFVPQQGQLVGGAGAGAGGNAGRWRSPLNSAPRWLLIAIAVLVIVGGGAGIFALTHRSNPNNSPANSSQGITSANLTATSQGDSSNGTPVATCKGTPSKTAAFTFSGALTGTMKLNSFQACDYSTGDVGRDAYTGVAIGVIGSQPYRLVFKTAPYNGPGTYSTLAILGSPGGSTWSCSGAQPTLCKASITINSDNTSGTITATLVSTSDGTKKVTVTGTWSK
jgi:hypothetical protein